MVRRQSELGRGENGSVICSPHVYVYLISFHTYSSVRFPPTTTHFSIFILSQSPYPQTTSVIFSPSPYHHIHHMKWLFSFHAHMFCYTSSHPPFFPPLLNPSYNTYSAGIRIPVKNKLIYETLTVPASLLKSLDLWLIEKKTYSIFCCSSAAFLPSLFSAALDVDFVSVTNITNCQVSVYIACHIFIFILLFYFYIIYYFIFIIIILFLFFYFFILNRMDILSVHEYDCGTELQRLTANNNIGQSQIFIFF